MFNIAVTRRENDAILTSIRRRIDVNITSFRLYMPTGNLPSDRQKSKHSFTSFLLIVMPGRSLEFGPPKHPTYFVAPKHIRNILCLTFKRSAHFTIKQIYILVQYWLPAQLIIKHLDILHDKSLGGPA